MSQSKDNKYNSVSSSSESGVEGPEKEDKLFTKRSGSEKGHQRSSGEKDEEPERPFDGLEERFRKLKEREEVERIDPMVISFDNNGNPMDEEEDGGPQIIQDDDDEEPNCFINAANLSEDEFILFEGPCDKKPEVDDPEIEKLFEKSEKFRKFKVPISKSYPEEIVQAPDILEEADLPDGDALNSEEEGLLAADSLEEIPSRTTSHDHDFEEEDTEDLEEVENYENPRAFDKGVDLTQSTLNCGIFAERPPSEAWVIDLNSLSLEDQVNQENNMRRSTGSNPNSLAFFVNIDGGHIPEKDGEQELPAAEKKIFSMFFDLENQKEQGRNSREVPTRPNVMNQSYTETSDRIKKRVAGLGHHINHPEVGNQIPLHLKKSFAAESTRRAALERIQGEKSGEIRKNMEKSEKPDMSSSNRSSLHVANAMDCSLFSNSLLSSMENSVPEEVESCQNGPCFKLGKDLLRMFQEEISTDVNISVSGGRVVRTHKFILASRSQYFAAILSGDWVEKAGNRINLDRFSYNVVYFTMHHIYSGSNEIPDSIDLLELATLTDLLGLEGLRENISQTIRVKYCHNFHRPCTGCISGVLECYPIALAYGMEELQRKMTKWMCKHFVRIWPTKGFANLGDEFIEKCLRYSVNHLSPENTLDIVLGCDQLTSTMPSVRWTEPIFSVVNQLNISAIQYIGENLSSILKSERFLQFGKGQSWNISRIEHALTQGLHLLKMDEACLAHSVLNRLIDLGTHAIDEVQWSSTFIDFLRMLRVEIERYLIANASRAVLSSNWETLSQECRKRICSSSFIGLDKSGVKKVAPSKGPPVQKSSARVTPIQQKPNTRVASVKPLQNVQQIAGNVAIPKSSLARPKGLSRTNSNLSTDRETPTKETLQNLVAGIPSKPRPMSNKTRVRHPAGWQSQGGQSQQCPGPATKFLTNSEKAKLVSKPKKGPPISSRPSSSISHQNSTSSMNSNPPQINSPSSVTSKESFSRRESRGSLSAGSERALTRTERVSSMGKRENSFTCSSTGQKLSVYNGNKRNSGSQKGQGNVNSTENGRKPTGSQPPKAKTPIASRKTPSTPKPSPKAAQIKGQDSSSADLMTKSAIEDSGEPKIRSLAEIGRSQTFSKDEPTLLGNIPSI